jgi:arginyl-tRNA synthetase
MNPLSEAKKEILDILNRVAPGAGFDARELSAPPDPALGDLAINCFALAKKRGENPAITAKDLAEAINKIFAVRPGFFAQAEAKGPYLNFSFNYPRLAATILREIARKKKSYGAAKPRSKSRVLLEYANPNTHKDIHVGHLRNFFLGHALVKLLRAMGAQVVPVSYINDLGAHVAKCVWAMEKFASKERPAVGERIEFLGRLYSRAVKIEEENPEAKKEISAIHRELEAGGGTHLPFYRLTRNWSLAELKAVFKELGLEIKKYYFESELIPETRRIIEEYKKRGIVKQSQSAWIVDLENQGLGVNLLVKSDGTLLYNAKDLALAQKKEKDFHPEASLYVVDTRQTLALRQLFATLLAAGFGKKLIHVPYEFVTLREGAMSSRSGRIIRYQDFRDEMIAKATVETAKRHPDWSKKKISQTARAIAFGAMVVGMLKQDNDRKIVFDMEEALSFDGFTGPYFQYTSARLKSILRKAGRKKIALPANAELCLAERRLVADLASYPEVLEVAAKSYRPAKLVSFLFETAKHFAEFYEAVPVLKAPGSERARRIALVAALSEVFSGAFEILGIPQISEM